MADRLEIAASLRQLALLMGLKGENRFKSRAYERAADALEKLDQNFDTLLREKKLTEISGVGDSIASMIEELAETGTAVALDRLKNEIPLGLIELSKLDGMSEQRLQRLHKELGIDSLNKLEAAISAGAIRGLKGFGPKTELKLRDALGKYAAGKDKLPIFEVMDVAERMRTRTILDAAVSACELAGEIRRYCDSIGAIELVAASSDPAATAQNFTAQPEVVRVEFRDRTRAVVRLTNGMRAELTAVAPEYFGVTLLQKTGSKTHVAKLTARAAAAGLTLGEIQGATEAQIYRKLGLEFVPPELREDLGEVEEAEKSGAFDDLLKLEDIRGLIHCHTKYSDGRASVEEMARAADAMNVEYMTITDHSPSAFYAHGVEVARLKEQWAEIDEVQKQVRVRLLRGTESDILAHGELDYPNSILENLEIVIASIHSRFQMNEDAMTERIKNAMRHPIFKIWGHPLGRLILKRDPVPIRMDEVLDEIAQTRSAIELSGDPDRFELQPEYTRAARSRGIKFVVSVDAHSTRALRFVSYGVALARRGGARKSEVLNTLSAEEFRAAVRPG